MPSKHITVCAHRGASRTFPENTITAFAEAVRLGCDQVEFDVRMTKDGECVILHDSSVNRTTDGIGLIWELTLKEVKALSNKRTIPNQVRMSIQIKRNG